MARVGAIIWTVMLSISWPITALSQVEKTCGEPPPVANESLKGAIKGEAQALSRYLGNAALTGQIQTSREEIFSKYPDAEVSRSNAYFEHQVCVLLLQDKSLTTIQKIEELKKIRREFSKPFSGISSNQDPQRQIWKTQTQDDIGSEFYGCIRESISTILCSVKLTNMSTKRKMIMMNVDHIWLTEEEKNDKYNPDKIRVVGKDWTTHSVNPTVDPEGFETFEMGFLLKPSAQVFKDLEIGLHSSGRGPKFKFPLK
jgi:hypothetical protein